MIISIVPIRNKTILYIEDGTIEIIDMVSSKFIKDYGYRSAILKGPNQIYKKPIMIQGELFYPTRSRRDKRCIWINARTAYSEKLLKHIAVLQHFDASITASMIVKIGLKYLKTREKSMNRYL